MAGFSLVGIDDADAVGAHESTSGVVTVGIETRGTLLESALWTTVPSAVFLQQSVAIRVPFAPRM